MTLKSNAPHCFICSEEVLELTGQYQNLQPYGLEDEHPIILSHAFGKCHSTCLEKSKWGKKWYEITLRQLKEVQKYKQLDLDFSHFFYRNAYDDCFFLYKKGSLLTLTNNEINKGEKVGNDFYIIKNQVFSLDLNQSDTKKKIMMDLETKKEIPLKVITDQLGITEKFHPISDIKEMTLKYNKPLAKQCFGNWISGELKYLIILPNDSIEPVKRFIKEVDLNVPNN